MTRPCSCHGACVPASSLLALVERWEAQGRPYADCSEPATVLIAVAAELRQLLPAAGVASATCGARRATPPEAT